MTDYLTCGQCLKEFPLQRITLFIQHKKLDCNDEDDVQSSDPELQCNYCPQGFMTAWALLLHAQITHKLKIFLESASKALLKAPNISPMALPKPHLDLNKEQLSGSNLLQQFQSGGEEKVTPERDKVVKTFIDGKQVLHISPNQIISTHHGQALISQKITDNFKDIEDNVDIGNLAVIDKNEFSQAGTTQLKPTHTQQVVTGDTLTAVPVSFLVTGKSDKLVKVPIAQAPKITPVSVTVKDSIGTQLRTISSSDLSAMPSAIQPEIIMGKNSKLESGKSNPSQPQVSVGQSRTGQNQSNLIATDGKQKISQDRCIVSVPKIQFTDTSSNKAKEANNLDASHKAQEKESPEKEANPTQRVVLEESQVDGTDSSCGIVGPEFDGQEMQGTAEECCGNQGCGVTVIPGSHQNLQKCCNAVVPKKRKRHMEMKHMPFSWSSSRYAQRRRMMHRNQAMASNFLGKSAAGTIFIDVQSDTLLSSDKDDPSGSTETATMEISQSEPVASSSSSDSTLPTETVLKGAEKKPHSLILKPGGIFSIPFTYTLPSSMTISQSSVIPMVPVSSINVKSGDLLTGPTMQQAADRKLEQTGSGNKGINAIIGMDNLVMAGENGQNRKNIGSKPFQCEKCSLTFNQRIHLKKHMSKHTGIKPYKCGECDYSTVERSHLKVHIRIHTGEKPFKCTYCEYATAQNSTLKIHLKRHHGGRMFQCNTCNKKFTQEQQLKGHEWEHGIIITSPVKKNELESGPSTSNGSPSKTTVSPSKAQSEIQSTESRVPATGLPDNILTNQSEEISNMTTDSDSKADS